MTESLKKPTISADAMPLTIQVLNLIIAVQDAAKAARSECLLRQSVGLPGLDWTMAARARFDVFAPLVEGVKRNLSTFESMLACDIPPFVTQAKYEALPERFVFDPRIVMGRAQIVECSACL